MIGIPLGLVAANAAEWLVHKYVLHGLGQDKRSFWSFHWHEHHRNARTHDHRDPDYERPLLGRWNGQSKEAVALIAGTLALVPLAPVAPFFVGTMAYCAFDYYRKHKRAHLDPAWARTHLPWHYDHHMGPTPHANWCVTRPWFDNLLGTRVRYTGTALEQRDLDKRARRAANARAREAGPTLGVPVPAVGVG